MNLLVPIMNASATQPEIDYTQVERWCAVAEWSKALPQRENKSHGLGFDSFFHFIPVNLVLMLIVGLALTFNLPSCSFVIINRLGHRKIG